MLKNILKPKKNYLLCRLGKNNDGGYLIGPKSIENTEALISFGISDLETPKEKAADLQRSRLARRGEYMEDQYTPLYEDRKTFDKYMKDARGKKPEEKLPLLRKATKIHKELPDEDKK